MMTIAGGRRALVVALTVCLAVLLVVASIGIAAAKKPDRPPGQGKKDTVTVTVQLQDIYPGTTSPTGAYRWLDVADQAYSASYRASYDYTQATVKVSYSVVNGVLRGKLTGRNLKPNFTYQVKLVGDPDPGGDADANKRIGFAGRWWRMEWIGGEWADGMNSNDADYVANHEVPDASSQTGLHYRYNGYMLFDYFTTKASGKASLYFQVDSSYHVLHKTTQRTRTANDGPIKSATFDPNPASKAYDTDYGPATVGVFGEWERLPVGGVFLAPGSYTCQVMLTEESFHGSGDPLLAGDWAGAMGAPISFEIPVP